MTAGGKTLFASPRPGEDVCDREGRLHSQGKNRLHGYSGSLSGSSRPDHPRKVLSACFLLRAGMLICSLFGIFICSEAGMAVDYPIKNWVCYYGNTLGPEHYARFDLAVLDGLNPPPLVRTDGKPVFLGYVSIGEVHGSGPYWEMAKGRRFLVRENKEWHSWIVDIRDPQWQAILLNEILPAVSAKGFDGFFLDTLDSALYLTEGKEGSKYAGVEEAAAELLAKMRRRYPGKLIAVNRGLRLLPRIAPNIDFILIENLYSYYDRKENVYRRVDRDTQRLLLQQVRAGTVVNPTLTVLTIDYAAPQDKSLAGEAIAFAKEKGFVPYVGNYLLDAIYDFTLSE